MNRTAPRLVTLILAISLLLPATAAGAEPALGGAITLADGTVLPPMPGDLLAPSAQAEMLAEQGGAAAPVAGVAAAGSDGAVAAEPLAVEGLAGGDGQVSGPAGPLPNGLGNEVLGFLPYWDLEASVTSRLRMDLLSTIAYFSVGIASNGALQKTSGGSPTTGWAGWTSAAMTNVINAAHARGVRVVPTITMHAWSYDYTAMSTLLNSASNRARLVSGVVSMVRDRRADGVNVDFEPVPSSLRGQFTALTREIKAGLVNAGVGSYVTVDTMAGAAAWSTGYDVAGLTAPGAADAIVVMAYDFSYAGSARAGGVAPYDSPYIYAAVDAMRDHLERVAPGRMIWGVPYYGRAWNTSTDAVNSTVRSPAASVSIMYYRDDSENANAKEWAADHGRRWDATGQVPYTVYRAGDGGWRQLYYDDPVSISLKYDMILRNGVAGTGIWALGMDAGTSDLWNVIESRFIQRVGRLSGTDRYATAAAVSSSSFGTGVPVAYVATGAAFPDALAAGPAAGRAGGPVLLTRRSDLPGSTAAELRRLKPQRIVVLGGSGAVSDAVVNALRGLATTGVVSRLAGADRYATAAAVSRASFGAGAPVAYVATGTAFADALAGGAAAGRQAGPILLTTRTALHPATAGELARLRPGRIVVLGGSGAIADGVVQQLRGLASSGTVTRLAGADRYTTSVAVSRATTSPGPRFVYLATGTSFPDGLAGSPPAVRDHGPLLLTRPTALPGEVIAELRRLNPSRVVILGGTGAVSATVMAQLRALWD